MTREEFLKKNESHPYLPVIQVLLHNLEWIPFLNIDFTEEELPVTELVYNPTISEINDKEALKNMGLIIDDLAVNIIKEYVVQQLIKNILFDAFAIASQKSISISDLKAYLPEIESTQLSITTDRLIFNQIYEMCDLENVNHTIVTNGCLAAEKFQDNFFITQRPSEILNNLSLYPVGNVGKGTICVDPYMKFNDNRFVIIIDKPITLTIQSLGDVSLVVESISAPKYIIKNKTKISIDSPEKFTLVNWDIPVYSF